MAVSFSLPALRQLPFLPIRRVIAIDPGSQAIKILLVEQALQRPRLLRQRSVDLPEEGLLSAEEFGQHLRDILADFGPHPVAVPLPQTQSMSVVVDVPAGGDAQQRQQIEDEIVRLSGLSEAAVVFDHVRLRSFSHHPNPFWVTLCREPEIAVCYDRLGLDPEDLCEVTTEANALMAAYRTLDAEPEGTVVVDLGATRTVVAVFYQGQGVHASAFASGSAAFTEAIANARRCATETAEELKRAHNLLDGPEAIAGLRAAVEGWHKEATDALREWLDAHRDLELKPQAFQFVLAGGGARQPGLVECLHQVGGLVWTLWPVGAADSRREGPPGEFAVAFGTAVQALGTNPQHASLLPPAQRASWSGQRRVHLLQSLNGLLLALLFLLLMAGTWQQFSLLRSKRALLERTNLALEKATATASFARRLVTQYERQQPVLESQRFTYDTLRTLALLRQARSNRTFWFVSFADPVSYYTVTQQGVTNPAPPMTNLLTGTNAAALKPGFIAELCLLEEGEAQRRLLSTLVTNLKPHALFANVDLLSTDRMRPIVDPAVTASNKVIGLSLELASNEFFRPPRLSRLPLPTPAPAREPRPSGRPLLRPLERSVTNSLSLHAP